MNTHAAVPLAAGEFGFDGTDFAFIANTLYEDAGISLPASKANLNLYRFGVYALEQFKGRLPSWPACESAGAALGPGPHTRPP